MIMLTGNPFEFQKQTLIVFEQTTGYEAGGVDLLVIIDFLLIAPQCCVL